MDRLSAKHKSLYDRFEMGQTSEAEEQRMYRLEDRMDKVGKKIKKSRKSPLNQGKKEVKTLGEKETRQDRRAGKDNLVPSYFGVGGDDPKKTKLQRDAKERTSDPDYKKPKAKTLKKSPLNQGLKTDLFPDFKPSGRNPNYKPGVKDEKQKTKKEKRKHKKNHEKTW